MYYSIRHGWGMILGKWMGRVCTARNRVLDPSGRPVELGSSERFWEIKRDRFKVGCGIGRVACC